MLDFFSRHADLILSISSIGFAASLIPTVWHQWRQKATTVPLATSVVTSALLAPLIFVDASQHWWLAAVTTGMTLTLWVLIAVERILYGDERLTMEQVRAQLEQPEVDVFYPPGRAPHGHAR